MSATSLSLCTAYLEQTRMKAWLRKAAAVTIWGSKYLEYLEILTSYIQLLHADLP